MSDLGDVHGHGLVVLSCNSSQSWLLAARAARVMLIGSHHDLAQHVPIDRKVFR